MKKKEKLEIQTREQEIGASIIKEAKIQHTEEQKSSVLAAMKEILRNIDEAKTSIQNGNFALAFFQRKVEAVREGKFTFLTFYNPPRLHFTEKALNGTWINEIEKGNT
jgi:hypothetical protein